MDFNDIMNVATFSSVLLGIVLILGKGALNLRNRDRGSAVEAHEMKETLSGIGDMKTELKSIGGIVDGINRVVIGINKNGSEGANKEFKEIKKTLANHRERLIRIEAHVNGGLDKVPPDNL